MPNIKPIHTDADYENALELMGELWDAEEGTEAHDQLELLGILVDKYEEQRFPIAAPDPVAAVLFYMEQNGIERAELGRVLGSRSRASEFINRKAGLSLRQIRILHANWNIPADILIQPVEQTG